MNLAATVREPLQESQDTNVERPREPRWDLAFVGILIYLFVEYMRLSAQIPFLQAIAVGKVAVGLAALGFLVSPRIQGGDRRPVRAIDFTLCFLVLASFLSCCFAEHTEPAWKSFIDLLRWVVIYFLIGRIVRSPWRVRVFVFLFLLLNLKMAQAAIRRYFIARRFISEERLAVEGVGAGSVGFFANSGDFGVAMSVVVGFTRSLLFTKSSKPMRLLVAVSFLACLGGAIVTGTRGALLAIAIVVLISWATDPKRTLGLVFALAIVTAGVYFMPKAIAERTQSGFHPEDDPTASLRLRLWKAGLRMFVDHPLLGVGIGNFSHEYYAKYATEDPDPAKWNPHSIYVQALSELGLLGSIPVFALFILCFRLNARTRQYLRGMGEMFQRRFEYRLAIGLDLALIAYMVSGAFITVLYYPHLWFILGLAVGLYGAVTREPFADQQLASQTATGDRVVAHTV